MKSGSRQDGRKAFGFTIVETMIVLAVTAGLFVAIAASLGGQQNKAEFVHAIQDVQTQIQQVINQVSTGYYPNNNDFTCKQSGNSVALTYVSTTNNQGSNGSCAFLGKIFQFGVSDGTYPGGYVTYTVASCNTTLITPTPPGMCATPNPPNAFWNVGPIIGDSSINFKSGFSTTSFPLEYGLTAVSVSSSNPAISSIYAVGFLMELGSLNSSSAGGYNSGTQPVDLVLIDNASSTSIGQSSATFVNNVDSLLLTSTNYVIDPAGGVNICLASSGSNQSGMITIGGSGRQLLVQLKVYNDTKCS